MKRQAYASIFSAVALFAGVVGGSNLVSDQKNLDAKPANTVQTKTTEAQSAPKVKPICDGTTVTSDCTFEGVSYTTYLYHEAVPEKSHNVTETTYEKKVTGYCTLCNDDTYSPSCATGRGACSYHGGVQEWNAPVYTNVQVKTPKTVVDAPAQDAYYDKVAAP